MGHRFAEIAFTPGVKQVQEALGSRRSYARLEGGEAHHDQLGPSEAAFIAARDSFYLASVSETGWPYIQHRGGPPGFLRVLDASHIGFADLAGNRQYISVGNLAHNDRVALFLMDYPNRTRLKLLGRARLVGSDDTATMTRLRGAGQSGRVERGIVIAVAAFDWNCPQHITPRYSEAELAPLIEPLQARIRELEAQLRVSPLAASREVAE